MSILETASRLVIVTRRFWPMTDDGSHRLFQLIDGLRSCGIEPQVLTARWHPSWPERATLRGARVTRILPSPRTNWNEGQFQRQVIAWLSQKTEQYDAIYVDRADGLMAAISAKSAKWQKPLIARFLLDGDNHALAKGQSMTAASAADACRRADRVIAPTANAHRILVGEGIDPQRIERIPDWVDLKAQRTKEARAAAAAALFQVSSDFVIPGRTDLIVHYGAAQTAELMNVATAVCDLLDQGASVRFWILGSGHHHPEILDAVKDRGWHREILLFDGFDDLEEIADVADLAIVSNPAVAFQYSAQLFLNSDIPLIALQGPETKSWLADGYAIKTYSHASDLLVRLQEWQVHRQQWLAEATASRTAAHHNQPSSADSLRQWEGMLRASSIGNTR